MSKSRTRAASHSPARPASGMLRVRMEMRKLIVIFALCLSAECALAGRNNLKPADFVPLTSLPWKEPDAKLESVLERIFREPDFYIRYGVLAEYLRIIPVAELARAFDLCIALEGAQTPDRMVDFFLQIWAKRDPEKCWKKTRRLFRVVGVEYGWLIYDSWGDRPRITVQDRTAIQASGYWIEDETALTSFARGVEKSSLAKAQKVRLMEQFASLWFDTFATWPGGSLNAAERPEDDRRLIEMFELPLDEVKADSFFDAGHMSGEYASDAVPFEVGVRRRMKEMPGDALKIIEKVRGKKWRTARGETESRTSEPSQELLTIWADVDFAAMLRWTDSLDPRKDRIGATARGLLISRVDQETRARWLKEAGPKAPDDRYFGSLLWEWAKWEPQAALAAAVETKDGDLIAEAISALVGGRSQCYNTWHFGLGVFKEFDFAGLPEELRESMRGEWGVAEMEFWGDVDLAEAARYGFDFMLRNDYAPRENLIKLFSGDDKFSSDSDMIDRTFCALRVWAVVKPRAMKDWIATIGEADMRKALTWLLEHPWGTGPKD